jgi:hypothetical protein
MWQVFRSVRVRPHLAASLLALASCDDVGEAIQSRVQAEVEARVHIDETQMPGTLAEPELTEQDRMADKLALYHECLRRSRGRIVESWKRWGQGVDAKTGGPKRGGSRPLVYPVMDDLQPCRRAAIEGPAQAPALPRIEQAAAAYVASATRFAEVAGSLDEYYGAERFKTDAWALGKQLGPELVAAHGAWETALASLSGELEQVRDGLDELRLAQAGSEQGPSMRWHCHRAMLAAKGFERCTRREPLTAGDCDGALATLEGRVTALREWADAHAAEAEQVFWWPSYDAALGDLLEDSEALVAALRKNKLGDELDALRDHHDEVRAAFDNLRY